MQGVPPDVLRLLSLYIKVPNVYPPEAIIPLLYQKMPWHAGMPSVLTQRTCLAALENEWHN